MRCVPDAVDEPLAEPPDAHGPLVCLRAGAAWWIVGCFDSLVEARAGRRSRSRATSRAAWFISVAVVGTLGQCCMRIASAGPA